ncbi:MAG: hypothetical protein COA45_12245 [Zetaproteobacteria bacterium]|nr:MAG: hypothetical protein COA45_12245 [Zetaproteobacteria bacterium]
MGMFFISSYGIAQEHNHGDENSKITQSIIEIMRNMNKNMHKLTNAIIIEDYPTITLSAHDIANHPGIDTQDLHHLFERLGPRKEDFILCDNAVHNLAIDISKAGEQENIDLVLEKYSAMIAKIVQCHREYKPKTGNKE